MANVFISHSSLDKEFATRLSEDLREFGHDPWLDEWEIHVGDCIPTRISEGIEQAQYMVLVLTRSAVESEWVDREWKAKYWQEVESGSTSVLPVLLEDCELPPLIRSRRYADFRQNYATGLVRLMAAMGPVLPVGDNPNQALGPAANQELADLIRRSQSLSEQFSETVALSLSYAQRHGHQELAEFCSNELTGYASTLADSMTESMAGFRVIEGYVSFTEVNMQYIGWGGSVSNTWKYISNDPGHFAPHKLFIKHPISDIEKQARNAPPNTLMTMTRRHADLNPEVADPDTPVYIYARGDAMENVLQRIRSELTKKLVALLPGQVVL